MGCVDDITRGPVILKRYSEEWEGHLEGRRVSYLNTVIMTITVTQRKRPA